MYYYTDEEGYRRNATTGAYVAAPKPYTHDCSCQCLGCSDKRIKRAKKLERLKAEGKISRTQYLDAYTGELSPKTWEETMDPEEVSWCWGQINRKMERRCKDYDYPYYDNVDSFRAAKAWKGSQVRRFKKARTCCGSHEWVAYRWSWKKFRFDKYLLGFNYDH